MFSRDHTWTERDLKSFEKAKFTGHHHKEEVPIYGGENGMEFLLSKMIPEFVQAATRLEWSWEETFDQFHCVLEGSPRTTWAEVIDTLPDLRLLGESGFQTATDHLIKKLLNNNFPRDQQWI